MLKWHKFPKPAPLLTGEGLPSEKIALCGDGFPWEVGNDQDGAALQQ